MISERTAYCVIAGNRVLIRTESFDKAFNVFDSEVRKHMLPAEPESHAEPEPRKQLFRCRTVNQFRIGAWLAEQGITDEDISFADFSRPDVVTIYNPAGQYMVVHWRDGCAVIDMEPET